MKTKHLLFLLIFYASAVQAQVIQLSLKQAIEFTHANNASMKNAVLEESISKQKVNELTGLGTPQVTGNAEVNHFVEIPTTFVPGEFFEEEAGSFFPVQFGQPYTATVGVSATQLLFDGSYLVGLQASRAYQDLSRKQTFQTKIETATTVMKAYYNVLVSIERQKLVNSHVTRLEKFHSDIKAMYETGFVEKLDLDRAEVLYNNIKVQQMNVEKLVTLSYLLLKFQMGMELKTPVELTDKLDETVWEGYQIPTQADPAKRIEYSLMQSNQRLHELDLKRYRSLYLPSLYAFGSLSANASRNEFNVFNTSYKWYPTAIVGARLSVPIWDGLQKHSKVQQAKLELEKIDNSMMNLQNAIQLEYETAKTNLENNLALFEASRKNKESANEIVRASRIKYDNGIGSSLEVTDAESMLKEAETNYFSAMYETIVSKIDLDKSLGNLKY